MKIRKTITYFCVVSYNDEEGNALMRNVVFNPKSNTYPPTSNDMVDLNTYIYMQVNVPNGQFTLLNIMPIVDDEVIE